MNARSRALAVATAAGTAILLWALLPRASTPEAETAGGDGPRGTAPPPSVGPLSGGLRGREDPTVGPLSAGLQGREEKTPLRERPEPASVEPARRVHGRVADAEGGAMTDCVVSLPWIPVVAPVRTDANGDYALTIPAGWKIEKTEDGSPGEVSVEFAAPGFAVVERSAPLEGTVIDVGARLGEGPVLKGTVVDPDGGPVGDFTVILRQGLHGFRFHGFDQSNSFIIESPDPRSQPSFLTGFAVTDREGRFRIRGMTSDPGRAVGHGEGWMLDGEQDVDVGTANRLRAVRAAVSAIRLDLPRGAAAPAEWELRFSDPERGGQGLTVNSPTTTIWWSRGRGLAPEVRAELAVHASGYEPMRQELVIPAEVTRRDVEFRLRPLAPSDDATVVFTLVTPDAAFARRPFDLEIHDAEKTESQVSRVHADTLPDGRVRARAPPGRWWLRLRPADGWCNPVYWEGEQVLAGRRENPVTWVVPPHGGARIYASQNVEGDLSLWPPGNGAGSAADPIGLREQLDVQALTVGLWRAKMTDGTRKSRTLEFTVRPGEVADVDLAEAKEDP